MQHELWCRFALPFVRLDSQGVARVKQKLPANRNPFSYFRRVIISIDTLKQERFVHDLRRHHWDAVVIDESHNVTNTATLNNRLASILAPQADALILASATPHNGSRESFAELVRLLDPTAVKADGDWDLKWQGKVYRTIRARQLWDEICEAAWRRGAWTSCSSRRGATPPPRASTPTRARACRACIGTPAPAPSWGAR